MSVRWMVVGAVALIGMLILSAHQAGGEQASALFPGQIGAVVDDQLNEISGLAVSPSDPQRLWVINDSGNGPALYAINRRGERMATVVVKGARNRDWEDLAAARIDGRDVLVIADIGDNEARRPYVSLYLVPEPALAPEQRAASVRPQRVIHFRYPKGPRDAEGVAVDAAAGQVLVLSKREQPPVLYAVPLESETPEPQAAVMARRVAEVATIPSPTLVDLAADPRFGIYASQPTALDYAPGVGLVVMTYARPYLYAESGTQSLVEMLSAEPRPVDGIRLLQAEAAAIDRGHVLVTSERLPAPLLRLALPMDGDGLESNVARPSVAQ